MSLKLITVRLKPALQGLNFHLPVGSMTYLVGHSGAGKSTLLKLIMEWKRRMPVIFGLMVAILRVCLNMKSHFTPPNRYGSPRLPSINGS